MKEELSYNRELCISSCRECEKITGNKLLERDSEGKILIPSELPRTDSSLISAARVCPSGALSVVGYSISAVEAVKLLCKDRPFFEESGGGVTLSGGEPLMQPEFTAEVLYRLKNEGVHTALDTCGDAEPDVYTRVSSLADLILFDFKAAGSAHHREWTGKTNARILANLERSAAEHPQNLRIRIPYIPGLNGVESELSAMADILSKIGVSQAELLPYHRFGIHKYRQQGKDYSLAKLDIPDSESLKKSGATVHRSGNRAPHRALKEFSVRAGTPEPYSP